MKLTLRITGVMLILLAAACQPLLIKTPTATADDSTLKNFPTQSPSPAPTALPTPTPGVQLQPSPTPFSTVDCAIFPGWFNCRAPGCAVLPLDAQLAWIDAASGELMVANFYAGKAWNLPAGGVTRLSWKPDGTQLLLIDEAGASLYPAADGTITRVDFKTQGWAPDGSLLPAGWVGSSAGSLAHLQVVDGLPAVLVRPSPSTSIELTLKLVNEPTDAIFRLAAWLPGSSLLLGQQYYAGNAVWTTGGQLFTLDTSGGAFKLLDARMLTNAEVAPHPTQPGLLALVESGEGGQRLAVLDALSGALTVITTDSSVWVSRPAWTVDGQSLLFAAWAMPLEAPSGAPFDLRAIYLTSPQGGPLVRLTAPPAGYLDDQPVPLADGKHFLFVRRPIAGGSAELRLGGLDGLTDELVVRGLRVTACQPLGCAQAAWDYSK